MQNARPQKHSLTLRGHRTSVSLEPAFWQAFRDQAAREGKGINQLAAEIDAARAGEAGVDIGLASAIRLYILARLTERAAD
ncbi:MAG: aryl-sulfate sulfotransferase [Rhodobacterales bacterium]|nr:MAG: aryl-sulfate sulfotransferase [Rhodobacterales bacterium]